MTERRPIPDDDAPALGVARRVGNVIRRIIGAPDYDAYVAHVRACHPDREPMREEEFRRARLSARYSQPGNRCC